MGVHIRVSHGQVHHRQAVFFMKLPHQADGLLHIRLRPAPFLHAEAMRPGKAVVDADPGRHQKVPVFMDLRRSDAVSQQTGAVFKASPVKPGTLIRGQKLHEQIAVAGLDIHGVKARLPGKKRGFSEFFLQPF